MLSPRTRARPAGPPTSRVHTSAGGIGRSASAVAERVSDDLRRHEDPFLTGRRRVAGLSLTAIAAMGAVTAYQTGLVRHLPEPPLGIFDADRVDASGEAYELFHTPDGALGLVSYGVTLALAAAGTRRRPTERPWLVLAMAAKVAADAVGGLYLTAEQASTHRRFCAWCLTASAASLAMVPAALPETRAAWRAWRSRR